MTATFAFASCLTDGCDHPRSLSGEEICPACGGGGRALIMGVTERVHISETIHHRVFDWRELMDRAATATLSFAQPYIPYLLKLLEGGGHFVGLASHLLTTCRFQVISGISKVYRFIYPKLRKRWRNFLDLRLMK